MDQGSILKLLGEVGAIITDSHIVYTSGRHGTAYVNKDALYTRPMETGQLCRELVARFERDSVEVVVAPAVGGVALTQWGGYYLCHLASRRVLAAYLERDERSVHKAAQPGVITIGDATYAFEAGDEIVVKRPDFTAKRGYAELITGRRVLVLEDVMTTGASVRKVIAAVRGLGAVVIGVGALCNRGGLTTQRLEVPRVEALVTVNLESWPEEECSLCKSGVPVNTTVGKGKQFLERRKS